MTYDADLNILKVAIKHFGERAQEEVAMEECAELIAAISRKHRGRDHNIPEEIADVEICIAQLKMINNCAAEVDEIRAAKIKRLYERICEKCF